MNRPVGGNLKFAYSTLGALAAFAVLAAESWAEPMNAPIDLKSAYLQALQKTESVGAQAERVVQAEARVAQSRGALFPRLAVLGGYTRQDPPTASPGSASSPEQSSLRLNLAQTLFRGFREFAGLRASGEDLAAQLALQDQSKLLLYSAVGQAYYTVLMSERDLENLQRLFKLSEDRVQELQGRVKIGRSRVSELLTAQSQVFTARTQIQAAQATLEQSRDGLAAVTGLDRQTELAKPEAIDPPQAGPLESYLGALDQRPDLMALRHQIIAADEQASGLRSAHWPTLEVGGNYYLQRTGSLEGSKWDVGLTLNFPIFQGGIVSAQVREASARTRELELLAQQARRIAERDVRVAHRSVQSGIEQLSTLREGLKTAEQNYGAQIRDYRFGLSTNLDVLQAMNALQETRRALDRTHYQTLIAWVGLQAALGRLP